MGTRQHGFDAAPKKVKMRYVAIQDRLEGFLSRHADSPCLLQVATMTAKCKATTSALLGFRLCGMKVPHLD